MSSPLCTPGNPWHLDNTISPLDSLPRICEVHRPASVFGQRTGLRQRNKTRRMAPHQSFFKFELKHKRWSLHAIKFTTHTAGSCRLLFFTQAEIGEEGPRDLWRHVYSLVEIPLLRDFYFFLLIGCPFSIIVDNAYYIFSNSSVIKSELRAKVAINHRNIDVAQPRRWFVAGYLRCSVWRIETVQQCNRV